MLVPDDGYPVAVCSKYIVVEYGEQECGMIHKLQIPGCSGLFRSFDYLCTLVVKSRILG